MRISAALPTGVAALLFASAERRRALEARLVPRLENAGFAEAMLPILDYAEPYEPLLSARRRGELYRFVDREGALLALRADFTPLLARLLAPRLEELELPLRLFYRGDVVRYAEERAGRLREFYQLGAELLGGKGELDPEEAQEEMLRRFLDLLTIAEGGRVRVVVGFAGALDDLLRRAGLERAAEVAAAVVRRERAVCEIANVGGVLRAIVEHGVPALPDQLGAESGERLRRLLGLCERLQREFPGTTLSLDLAEFTEQVLAEDVARSLAATGDVAYYDGLIFRAFVGRGASPVGGGGRYDRLFARLGADVTAVGFSLGIDRLAEADASGPRHATRAAEWVVAGTPEGAR